MKNTFLWIHRLLSLFIIICFCTLPIYAQNQQITGRVLDKGNEPIIGASVLVKGTTNGTITNLNWTEKHIFPLSWMKILKHWMNL